MEKSKFVEPLTQDICTDIENLFSERSRISALLTGRVNYIIEEMARVFNVKISWWSFSNPSEYVSEGSFEDSYGQDYFEFEWELDRCKDCTILNKDGRLIDLNNEFPTRWLYEPFEDELLEGKSRLEQKKSAKKAANKAKQLLKKKEKELLLEQLKGKLSAEEMKVLKLVNK